MDSTGKAAIELRYAELIRDICAAIERGEPPWWNQTARLGPAVLGRSGQCLRGLPGVIAWHVDECAKRGSSRRRNLAWRLRPPAEVDVASAAVFELAANGGSALYAAIPERRPRQVRDGPTREDVEFWPLDGLRERLDEILAPVADLSPPGPADRPVIASLAQAFIRPLGDARPPTPVPLDGAWTHARLARVAAWARLLADDVRRAVHWPEPPSRPRKIPFRWPHLHGRSTSVQSLWRNDAAIMVLREVTEELGRSGWLQQCHPAELRQPVLLDGKYASDRRHFVPEQPLRDGIFETKSMWRAQALGGVFAVLAKLTNLQPFQRIPWLMEAMQWRDKAALGLTLAELFGQVPVASEPGLAWRYIGRWARDFMASGPRARKQVLVERMTIALRVAAAEKYWYGLHFHHLARTWLHPMTDVRLGDLVRTGRWQQGDLDDLLAKLQLPAWDDGGRALSVGRLPIVRIATLRRPRKSNSQFEADLLTEIAEVLQCDEDWATIAERVRQSHWERQKRTKRSGGIRWLDIPEAPLRDVQKMVSALLLSVTPSQGTPTAFHPGASPALHARSHAGAIAAVRMDLADFFGSVHPWHLEPWLGLGAGQNRNLLPDWSPSGREALMALLFVQRTGWPYLPQGAPSSPAAANLAGLWLDQAIIHRAVSRFGAGKFVYTRYADDLVLSTRFEESLEMFHAQAEPLLLDAVAKQRWRVQKSKTRRWSCRDAEHLHLCGIRVPADSRSPLSLDRATLRRARAALHRLRHRLDFDRSAPGSPNRAHGLLAYCYSATADLRWLAYTSRRVQNLAWRLAGPLFSESFLAGWSDDEPVVNQGSRTL